VAGLFPHAFRSHTPNLLILTIDTLRADHVGFMGASNPTTPNLDRFARLCFVLEAAYAPRGETSPSLASAFTGLYPSQHGVFDNHCLFPPRIETLAALAGEAGFRTAAFLANKAIAPSKIARDFQTLRFTVSPDRPQWQDDEAALAAALEFLKSDSAKPFFLWVHFMDPHSPYEPGPQDRGAFGRPVPGIDGSRETLQTVTRRGRRLSKQKLNYVRALYDEEIRGTDRRAGRLLSALEKAGLLRNTIVVIFGDHGEELGDHHLYFFHQVSVYRQVLHVPLLWYVPPQLLPRGVKPKALSGVPVSLLDVAPTAASYLGLRFSKPLDGVNLRGLFEGRPLGRKAVAAEYADKIDAVLTDRYHAIYNPTRFSPYGGPFPSPEERRRDPRLAALPRFVVQERELYDMQEDPLEQENLASVERRLWKRLRARITAFRKAHPFRRPLRVGSGAALRVLRQLGYIQGPSPKPQPPQESKDSSDRNP